MVKLSGLLREIDDLKFLYSKIQMWKNLNDISIIVALDGNTRSYPTIIDNIIQHFHNLYNSHASPTSDINYFPVGPTVPSHLLPILSNPITAVEIKLVVFSGSSNSSHGPNVFNFHFLKSGWHIIWRHL